jgi:hypothetical protein
MEHRCEASDTRCRLANRAFSEVSRLARAAQLDLASHFCPDFESQPGLADPTDSTQREEPSGTQEFSELRDHVLATDQ